MLGYSHYICPTITQWSYPAKPVVIVALRVHIWVRLMFTFLPSSMNNTFLYYEGWSIEIKFKVNSSFISLCSMIHVYLMLLSLTESYSQVLVSNQRQWQWSVLYESLYNPRSTTPKDGIYSWALGFLFVNLRCLVSTFLPPL